MKIYTVQNPDCPWRFIWTSLNKMAITVVRGRITREFPVLYGSSRKSTRYVIHSPNFHHHRLLLHFCLAGISYRIYWNTRFTPLAKTCTFRLAFLIHAPSLTTFNSSWNICTAVHQTVLNKLWRHMTTIPSTWRTLNFCFPISLRKVRSNLIILSGLL